MLVKSDDVDSLSDNCSILADIEALHLSAADCSRSDSPTLSSAHEQGRREARVKYDDTDAPVPSSHAHAARRVALPNAPPALGKSCRADRFTAGLGNFFRPHAHALSHSLTTS